MAVWKKVLVSGSAIHVTSVTASVGVLVGTNQSITTNASTTFLSGSFTGSFTGSFSGNGAGLTGVTATPTFPTTVKTDLASTDKFFINDDAGNSTAGNKQVTYQNLIADLAGTNLTSSDAGDSLTLASQISVTGVTASFNGNLTGTATSASYVTGSVHTSANPALSSSYALTSSFAATAPYSGLINTPSGLVSSSVLSSPAQGQALLTTNGVAGSTIDLGLETADSPTFAGLTISTNALAVNNTNGITTTQTTFPIVTSNATNITLGGPSATVTIPGNLTIQGTSTIVSSSNLTVVDKFVFISSGSTSSTNEGGIIVSNAVGMTGSAFYYEGSNTRWALAPAVGATDTAAAPNSFVVSVSGSATDPTGDPTYGGSGTGYGNMFINTTSQDIFIYV